MLNFCSATCNINHIVRHSLSLNACRLKSDKFCQTCSTSGSISSKDGVAVWSEHLLKYYVVTYRQSAAFIEVSVFQQRSPEKFSFYLIFSYIPCPLVFSVLMLAGRRRRSHPMGHVRSKFEEPGDLVQVVSSNFCDCHFFHWI